jgi:hypothetical protein
MKPIARKHRRLAAILLFPLLAMVFLAGFAFSVFSQRKQHRTKQETKLQVHKQSGSVTLETIYREEELQVQIQ